MKISIIHEDVLLERIADIWGDDLSLPDLAAEMFRSELAARTISSRRALCNRVMGMLTSIRAVDLEDLKTQLFLMEKIGDVTSGPGGKVAAAPLRAVKVGADRYQLFGTVDYRHLTSIFTQSEITPGENRFLVPKNDDLEFFRQRIDLLGGLSLSPERWAGLDKIGAANTKWIQNLDERLENYPIAAGSLNRETNGEWRTYRPEKKDQPQNKRWAKDQGNGRGQLWRIWHQRGWPIHVWTKGLSPEKAFFTRLTGEEASRAMFALDKATDMPIPYVVSEERGKTIFRLGGFLPGPEYRFLTTRGTYSGKSGDYYCFQFDPGIWTETAKVLSERLGIPG